MKLMFKQINHKKLSDEKLMLAIQQGSQPAFNELYRRYNQRLLYYFYRMLGNDKELAQDFLQDCFLKVIDKAHYYQPGKPFKTWIFSMAHNQCKNEYRSRDTRSKFLIEKSWEVAPIMNERGEGTDIQPELIFEALNDLDETHRTAFLLKYREGFDIQEISEIMDISPGTIKSRLFYTRKKLQKQLSKHLTD